MKRLLTAHASALAVLLAVGAGAQATPLPPSSVAWTYNWSPGAPAVTADGNPGAGISFTNEPTKSAVGSSDIVATNLRNFSTSTAAAPDMLSANGAYSLTLTLTTSDATTGDPVSTTMKFTGKLTGPFSAENSFVGNVFNSPTLISKNLGGYTFTVEMIAYTPPGPPDQSNAGSISAHVTVSAINPSENPDTPEPCTLLLSGLGMTFLGGVAWRKRRRVAIAKA